MTQAQLAERLGISQQSYARLEARPAATSVAQLKQVLRVLNAELVIHAVMTNHHSQRRGMVK